MAAAPAPAIKRFVAVALFLKTDEAARNFFTDPKNREDLEALTGQRIILFIPDSIEDLFKDPGKKRFTGLDRGSLPCLWAEDDNQHFLVGIRGLDDDQLRDVISNLADTAETARNVADWKDAFNRRQQEKKSDVKARNDNSALLFGLTRLAGVGGLGMGILYLLFSKLAFPKLAAGQANLFMLLIYGIAVAGLLVWAAEKIKGRLLPLLLAAVCCFMAWLGWSQARPDPVLLQTSITYDVRVTVLSPGQVPVDDARVWSSRGGEPKKVDGGWEFDIDIPRNEIPAKLTVWASVDSRGWSGSQDLMLNEDHSVPAGIQLAAKGEVPIMGMVVHEDGNSIANALVWIVGNGKDVRNSDGTGNFELPSHALPGATVTLHAEKPPLLPAEKDYVVGSGAVRLTLRAASRPVPRGNQMHGTISNAGRVPGSPAEPPGNPAPVPNQAGASSSPATVNAGQL
jgi:hypothetical protein